MDPVKYKNKGIMMPHDKDQTLSESFLAMDDTKKNEQLTALKTAQAAIVKIKQLNARVAVRQKYETR